MSEKQKKSLSIPYLLPIVGIDIGGTLSKVCIALKKNSPIDFTHIDHLTNHIVNSMYSFRHSNPETSINSFAIFKVFSQAQLDLKEINKSTISHSFYCQIPIIELNLNNLVKEFYITGGGAHKFEEEFLQKLQVKVISVQEFESIKMGFFLLEKLSPNDSVFQYNKNERKEYFSSNESLFPFILVNIGSGVSIVKFKSEGEFERVNGTSIGGGFFLGLSHLFTEESDFDKLLEKSNAGNNKNLDLYVSDLYGSLVPPQGIHGDALCISMGKMASQLKEGEDTKDEDSVKSLLLMTSFNLSQIAFVQSQLEGINNIIFAGNFVRNHKDTMDCINHAIQFFNKNEELQNKRKGFFVKHDGFIGALGAFYQGFTQFNITQKLSPSIQN